MLKMQVVAMFVTAGILVLPAWQGRLVPIASRSSGTRAAPGQRSRYLLASGNVQAVVFHSSGYALTPWNRAAEFNVPILIMHGTADGPADGGGPNTGVELARKFEAALRKNQKPVEAAYCEGCGHNTFFTNSTQREEELTRNDRVSSAPSW